MTTIEQHISNLLYTHECIIIPDFGAFVASTISARIDTDKNILLPPSKEIGFNRSLSHNDGLLISTYAQIKGISYSLAKIEVEQLRIRIVDQLELGNEVRLEKIGTLKSDAMGNVQFTSFASENYLPDSFGLTSFHFAPDLHVKPVNENVQVKRLLKPLSQRSIAAAVTLMIGLFAISPKMNDVGIQNNAASTIDFLTAPHSTDDAIKVDAEVFTQTAGEEELTVEEQVVEENHYFIIAGSFKKESQANTFLKQIHAAGEEQAFVLKSPKNRYRIALDGYANKPEAVNSMNNYRLKEDFKTVWVLKQ